MIYKITIWQTQDETGLHYSFDELYADVDALKKAFESMNSEVMFGELVEEDITPCWENDCFSKVIRKKRNWKTEIRTSFVVPKTVENLRRECPFSMERSMGLMVAF